MVSPGVWNITLEAQLRCQIDLPVKGEIQQVTVSGYGKRFAQVASDANWQLTYSRAFEDFLKNLDSALAGLGL
jgi:hypothetical protein